MHILNEEIRVIQHTMSHVKRAISFAETNSERLRLEKQYKELGEILEDKLSVCSD